MNLVSAISWFDVGVLLVVLWCAVDGSRQVHWKDEPVRSIAYGLLAVGTMAYMYYRIFTSLEEAIWTTVMHFAIMLYAVLNIIRRGREADRARLVELRLRSHH